MKKFFKYLLATFTGTLLGLVFFVLIGVLIVVSISFNEPSNIENNSILYITLNESITEKTIVNPIGDFTPEDDTYTSIGLQEIIASIRTAANDPRISGIVLKIENIQAGYANITELREALSYFKDNNKFIYSFADIITQKSFLLTSVANKVYMNPQGIFELKGLSSQAIFFKNLLEKIGIEPVIFRAGKYKGAIEPLVRENLSENNREQIQAYIKDVWADYSETVLDTRNSILDNLDTCANNLLVWNAESAKTYGLIDDAIYYNEFLNIVKDELNISLGDNIPQVSLTEYMQMKREAKLLEVSTNPNKLAYIIAEGSIVTGEGDDSSIGGDALARKIRTARKDSLVKAIVLRINSGGGSALASEVIWKEVQLASETKPLIVSMGDYAASGGYYIATPARYIIADASTLTGSIGVFGMYMKANKLFDKIGIQVDTVNTNNYSDIGTVTRSLADRELQVIEKGIDDIYTTFKKRVSVGRRMSMAQVQEIAQGRIWSGVDALEIGLIDKIGSVQTAIDIAVEEAGLGKDYYLETYEEPQTILETLLHPSGVSSEIMSEEMQTLFGKDIMQYYDLISTAPKTKGVYMQMPYMLRIE